MLRLSRFTDRAGVPAADVRLLFFWDDLSDDIVVCVAKPRRSLGGLTY